MSFRAEVWLALALAAALGIALVAGRRTDGSPLLDVRASTLVSGPRGARAVYDVLARLGRPVARRRRPLFDLADDTLRPTRTALLIVLDPPSPLDPAELEAVVAFVEHGGAVLAAGPGGGITPCVGWRARSAGARWGDSVPVVGPAGLRLPPVSRVLAPPPADTTELEKLEDGLGAAALTVTRCEELVATGVDTLLRLTDGRPVILRLRYVGGGQVTLAADRGYFTNRVWRDTDAPIFLVPLFDPPRRGRVVWDEYHQGEGEGGSLTRAVAGWLVDTPVGRGLIQLAVVALVALAVAAVRFGPARAVVERRRRSPLEHLEALAAGLEGAAGVDTAVGLVVTGLRRRLGRAGHLAPGDAQQWLATLELALPTPRGRQAARRLRAAISQPGGAERVLAAAHAVEDVWQDLRPRTTRN